MRLPHNSFVVVADGEKMLFFRNEGDAEFPQLIVERNREQENPLDRDQKTDLTGRSTAGAGPGQNSYGEVDFHRLEKDRFAHETAEMLKRWALRNDLGDVVIVAPPKTLGELRKHYHKEVEKRIVGEIPKDYTNMPIEEIEKALLAHA